jgi:ABC-type multidrug transport system permease subunit
MGVPFYAVGAAIFAVGLLFFIFRYGLGLCGGKKSRNVQGVTRFTRHCTFVTCIIGLLLFIAGIITALVGGIAYRYGIIY